MRSVSDIIGIFLSGICAIQCAMLPILVIFSAVLPGWAHFAHGWAWISVITLVACWSFFIGWKKHHSTKIIALGFLGLLVLITTTFLEGKVTLITESLLFVIGGLLMVTAHWQNYQQLSCKK